MYHDQKFHCVQHLCVFNNIKYLLGNGILIQLALFNHQHIVPKHKAIDLIWLEHPHPTPPI
jgi:hypothetical protein